MIRVIQSILQDIRSLQWYILSLVILYILQACHTIVPDIAPLQYQALHPEYTYRVIYYFMVDSLIDINIIYIVYQHYKNLFTELLLWIAVTHFIDQFTKAAIQWTYSEVVWVISFTVYFYYSRVWKKK